MGRALAPNLTGVTFSGTNQLMFTFTPGADGTATSYALVSSPALTATSLGAAVQVPGGTSWQQTFQTATTLLAQPYEFKVSGRLPVACSSLSGDLVGAVGARRRLRPSLPLPA